jgi:hypothetical protein
MEMALQRGDVDRTMAGGLHGAEQLRCHVEYKALVDDLARTPELLDDIGQRTLHGKEKCNAAVPKQ